ncbi:MAG TPA: hypothetical protein VK797_30620 [Tepidisphaeraceae bacterium]|jgi:hypothetical protein|nr:hypothetical protein [Tepidisphaeraceae bacterium]
MDAGYDAVLNAVFDREKKRFRSLRHPNGFVRLWRSLMRVATVNCFLVVEYEAVDPQNLLCGGAVLQAWQLDDAGVRSIATDDVDPGPAAGRYWTKQLVRLFIPDDNGCVFLNEMEGPKYGTLLELVPKTSANAEGLRLKVKRARIVLNGTVMG